MTYGLDTSVVLRLLMCEPPALAEKVQIRIDELIEGGNDLEISDLVLSELYFALQCHYQLKKERAILTLRQLAAADAFKVSENAKTALATPELWKTNPGFIDRMQAGAYAAKGHVTLTCEKSFRKLDLVEVIRDAR